MMPLRNVSSLAAPYALTWGHIAEYSRLANWIAYVGSRAQITPSSVSEFRADALLDLPHPWHGLEEGLRVSGAREHPGTPAPARPPVGQQPALDLRPAAIAIPGVPGAAHLAGLPFTRTRTGRASLPYYGALRLRVSSRSRSASEHHN
jgi:hypothetical protein